MLTNIEQLRKVRDISTNLKDGRITPYIKEVEDAYIIPAISAEVYEALDAGIMTDDTLMYGGYYTNGEGKKDICHGVCIATAYYAYARVLKNNQINVTAFGVTTKQGQASTPTSSGTIDDAVEEARRMGEHYLASCVRYLNRYKVCSGGTHGGSRIKMEVIR